MQVRVRKPCDWSASVILLPEGTDEVGYEYMWVDLASAILEILESGQSPKLVSFIRDCGEHFPKHIDSCTPE